METIITCTYNLCFHSAAITVYNCLHFMCSSIYSLSAREKVNRLVKSGTTYYRSGKFEHMDKNKHKCIFKNKMYFMKERYAF